MNLAISNIAWDEPEEKEVFSYLKKNDIHHIELAPSKVFSDAASPAQDEVTKYMDYLSRNQLQPVSFQSLFYPRPELNIFSEPSESLEFMKGVVDLAHSMGVSNLVFGSPKNRDKGELTGEEVSRTALSFFRELGAHAASKNVSIGMEANAPLYNCNFLTGTPETIDFIREVNSPGIGLNLDLGTVRINSENIGEILESGFDTVRHVHLSEPYLKPVKGDGLVEETLSLLASKNYRKYVSIEMRRPEGDDPVSVVRESINEVLALMP